MENLQLKFLTNKITIRWLKILNVLENKKSCSAQQISELTHLSDRTVIKEIKDIREYFGKSICLTTNNMGYLFKENNYSDYSNMKRQMVSKDPMFIVIESILEGRQQSVEEWAYEFHLSESTMKRYILSVLPSLAEYELQVSLTPVDLIGEEIHIRKFLKDFYYEVSFTPHTLIPFQDMKPFILQLEEEQKKLTTDVSPSDFRYFLYIMIQRSRSGRSITNFKPKFVYKKEESEFIDSLKKIIYKLYRYIIDDSEMAILYIYCMSQRRITEIESELNYCIRFSYLSLEKRFIESFLKVYDEDLYNSEVDITYFIEAFFISIKLLESIDSIMNKNPSNIIDFSKKMYPKEYTISKKFLDDNQKILGISPKYIKDISASLVLMVESIRYMYLRNTRRIAFLIEGSYYIRQIIQSKAYRYLRGYHKIFFPDIGNLTRSYFELNQIDLFVTNHEEFITEICDDIDFLLVKSLPDETDWNRLLDVINPKIAADFSIRKSVPWD